MTYYKNRALAWAACAVLTAAIAGANDNPALQADWETRTGACAGKIQQSGNYTVTITGVNDVAMDFRSGRHVEYQFRAKGAPAGVAVAQNPFTSRLAMACGIADAAQLQSRLDRIKAGILAVPDPDLTPAPGISVPLSASLAAAYNYPDVAALESDLAGPACRPLVDGLAGDPVLQWLKRLNGSHSVEFHVNLEPNQTYAFTFQESWQGRNTGQRMNWSCGNTDLVSMSLGSLVTALASRTYGQQKAPSPPGSADTRDILVVDNNSRVSAVGAALLNYHFPPVPWVSWAGLAVSAGPVYQPGNSAPSISSLGMFFGLSVHLSGSVYLTPGVHIGQFADFPAGFSAGAVIPDGFGDLAPTHRNTARLAVGITFKATGLKKSTPAAGAPANPAPVPPPTSSASQKTRT